MSEDREHRIRQKAYELWEQQGRPEGRHDAHWHEAERAIDAEDQGAATPKRAAEAVGTAQSLSQGAAEASARPRRAAKQEPAASAVEAVKTKQEADTAKPRRSRAMT